MTAPLVVGNWKMHGTQSQCCDLARRVVRGLKRNGRQIEVALAPPQTALAKVKTVISNSRIRLAAQDCHWEDQGAFTGEVSAAMLKDVGCEFVILGHSERRHILNESDLVVAKKVQAALRNRLRAILCVGETLAERQTAVPPPSSPPTPHRVEGLWEKCYREHRNRLRTSVGHRYRTQRHFRANCAGTRTNSAVPQGVFRKSQGNRRTHIIWWERQAGKCRGYSSDAWGKRTAGWRRKFKS